MRKGPQATHPAESVSAPARTQTFRQTISDPTGQTHVVVQEHFETFHPRPSSAAPSAAALASNDPFASRPTAETGTGAMRYLTFDLTLSTGVQYASSVENKDITLFADRRIARS